ncbi:MAG: hypothetical protein OYL97_08840 [Candidatus Poribacteria bacterium]|nr:hypothetical protein [Candidatus Poribacteria bacterium]
MKVDTQLSERTGKREGLIERFYPMVDAYYTTDESHYNECLEKGTIVPTKDWYGKRFYVEDFLAGDHKYIFMFVNDRYSIFDEDGKDKTFGFVLDAELLVTESNALVGPDLLNEYRSLINECATFSVQQDAALKNPQLIVRGLLAGAVTEPGVTETMLLFRTRVSELQNERRCQGEAALKRLRESTEPLELLVGRSSPSSK